MTIAVSQSNVIYHGNGSIRVWDIPFPFLSKDDLKVYQVLGHDRKKINYYSGISDDVLNRLDTYLKKVGLGLDIKLTEEQLNILKNKNKDAIK